MTKLKILHDIEVFDGMSFAVMDMSDVGQSPCFAIPAPGGRIVSRLNR